MRKVLTICSMFSFAALLSAQVARPPMDPMMNPDYNMIASAYGIPNRTVVEREDLAAAIQEMVDTDGPYLLQVAVIEEGRVLPMCCPGNDVDDMVLDY